MKKIAFMLALVLALGCLGFACAEKITSGDFEYILLENGTAEITKYTGEAAALEIPSELDGYAVSSISDFAFYHCDSLTEITIPDSVVSVGSNPFQYCEQLTNIHVSPDHPTLEIVDGVLFDKTEKKLICYPCALTADCYSIPQGILTIGDSAFESCRSLTSVTIPDSVTTIGESAFGFCRSLTSVTIPDSVTTIEESTFYFCDALSSITIPDGVTTIGDRAFANCAALGSVEIPDSVTSIGEFAFHYCAALKNVTISDGVVSIGRNAFLQCFALEYLYVPASVTSIGNDAFANNHKTFTLAVERDSYAAEYAEANGLAYTYSE